MTMMEGQFVEWECNNIGDKLNGYVHAIGIDRLGHFWLLVRTKDNCLYRVLATDCTIISS